MATFSLPVQKYLCLAFISMLIFITLPCVYGQENVDDCVMSDTGNGIDKLKTSFRRFEILKGISVSNLQNVRKLSAKTDSFGLAYRPLPAGPAPSSTRPIIIPVVFHTVRKSDGSGGSSKEDLYAAIEAVNLNFRTTGMIFTICEIREIKSDILFSKQYLNSLDKRYKNNFLLAPSNTPFKLLDVINRNVNNKLNIYVVPSNEPAGKGGNWSNFPNKLPWRQHITFRYNSLLGKGKTVLTHEIGHWFDLLHTHQGNERVTRQPGLKNCDFAGDHLCDTPADPNGEMEGCQYTGHKTDNLGQRYTPDTHNFMSYYGHCRNSFSPDQIRKMLSAYFSLDDDRGYELYPCPQPYIYPKRGEFPAPFKFTVDDERAIGELSRYGARNIKTWYSVSRFTPINPTETSTDYNNRIHNLPSEKDTVVLMENIHGGDQSYTVVAQNFYTTESGERASANKDTAVVTVYKLRPGPQHLSASTSYADSVVISWTPSLMEGSYVIYSGTAPGRLTEIGRKPFGSNHFTDTRFPGSNSEITYFVKRIYGNNRFTDYSDPAVGLFKLSPLIFSATRESNPIGVRVRWGFPLFTNGYNSHLRFFVYRSETNDYSTASIIGEYGMKYRTVVIADRPVSIPDGYTTEIFDNTALPGTRYYYWVRCKDTSQPVNFTPPSVGVEVEP